MWDAARVAEIRRISIGARSCPDGVVALDGDAVASTCDDATLRRWDASGQVTIVPTTTWRRVTDLSPDGATLAMAHVGGNVALVDVASWKIVADKPAHAHHVYGVQYAPDGRLVTASLDDHVRVWRGRELAQELDVKVNTDDGVLAAALSPDGRILAIGTQDGSLHVWDVAAAKWLVRDLGNGKLGVVWKLTFSRDGAFVITATDDGVIRLWNTKTWAAPIALDVGEGPALTVAVSPDGARIAAGYKSGAIAIWNAATHKIEARIGSRTRDRDGCAEPRDRHGSTTHRAALSGLAADAQATAIIAARAQRLDEIGVAWDWAWVARS
jgi:WD40 repeat protein